MDIWDYFFRFQDEVRRRSGIEPDYERCAAYEDSDGRRGVAIAVLPLREDCYLRTYEVIEIVDRRWARRTRYAYVLVIKGRHAYSWELDPTHEVPVHEHSGPRRTWRSSEPISLKVTIDEVWLILTSLPLPPAGE